MRPNGQNTGVLQKFAAPPPTLQNQTPTKVAKILIGLENAPPAFNLRNRVIGESGANLHYIRTETGALATLRGRGSMFIDATTGCESQEPLHLFIEHYSLEGIKEAENLAKNLVETLQQELNYYQDRNSPKPQIQNPPPGAIIQQPPQNQVVLTPSLGIPPPPPPVLAVPPPASSHIIQTNGIPQTITNQHISHIHMNPMNVNLPPPGVALTHPPPNVQFQASQVQQHSQPTQILVNQTPMPQYHYQYIQTNGAQIQPGQLTIQHLIQQPQTQQIQGLTIPQQIEHLQPTQSGQSVRPPSHHQQIITVQGNTFMMPPPNLQIQQQIFHPQQQQHIVQHPPPGSQHGIQTIQMLQPAIESSQNPNYPPEDGVKEEINDQSPIKTEGGTDKANNQSPSQMPLPPPPLPRQNLLGPPTSITLPLITQPPPSIMSIPPPGIQHHIVGNNIITTTQTPTQIMCPVSIPQQIQMAPGQQFVTLHSQQWATAAPQHQQQTGAPPPTGQQIQQIHHFPPQMQNIQFTSQTIRQPNEIQFISHQQQQPLTTATFNPQLQPPTGLVQFHQVPSSQIIHQLPASHTVFEQPPQQGQTQSYQHPQHQFNLQGPPPFGLMQHQVQQSPMHHTTLLQPPPPTPLHEGKLNRNEHSPQPISYPSHAGTKSNKRKLEDEDGSPPIPITKPKLGMGSNSGGSTPINTINSAVSTVTSINADKNNTDMNPVNQLNNQQVDQQQHYQQQLPQQHMSPQGFMQNEHQRPYYQRDTMENFQQDCDEPSGSADYGPTHGGMRNFRPPPFFMGGGRPMPPAGRFGDNYPNRFPPPYRGEGYGPPRFRQQW